MNIQTIEYSKTFNLGNYSNHKIGLVAVLGEGESPVEAFAELKKTVERSHQFFIDLPNYERAKHIFNDALNYTGNQLKNANDAIKAFEDAYPDYIRCFVPASRTLTQGVAPNNDDLY